MNGTTRKKWYSYISNRDGEYCKCCGKLSSEGQLILDHIDNNPSNNSPENFQILCRACNFLKNPRRPLDLCENTESCLKTNRTKEPEFKAFVYAEMENAKSKETGFAISENYLVNSGAEKVGLSPVTTKRYLDKMCSRAGKLERVFGHSVRVKISYMCTYSRNKNR